MSHRLAKLGPTLDVDKDALFDAIARGKVFELTGATTISFEFHEGQCFHLDFSGRGSISGLFKRIEWPILVELSWDVSGFDRPDERTEVCISVHAAGPGLSHLQITHQMIASAQSLQAKDQAWAAILKEFNM